MRLLGLDPGLRSTGWGIIDATGNSISYVASGTVSPEPDRPLAERLMHLHGGLAKVIAAYRPDEAAVEETFVNRNAQSTLKLGHARGVVLLAPALAGLAVSEYAAKHIKKAIVGTGRAHKDQIGVMVRTLLPGCDPAGSDAADALAVAICHAHASATRRRWAASQAAEIGR